MWGKRQIENPHLLSREGKIDSVEWEPGIQQHRVTRQAAGKTWKGNRWFRRVGWGHLASSISSEINLTGSFVWNAYIDGVKMHGGSVRNCPHGPDMSFYEPVSSFNRPPQKGLLARSAT
ncbi:hypothetical protein TREMEDRAFT_64362 [Tremella mesenterica DSM 1558]|uniref:uncharacterized protein n=1 Tax=Tremella mesenterica (strain ATCC 24925 / CBS 8224 / DSM 1558 / NBRC 9311 / NRRL Y-6157 / RJB 2259-6 / UBC 559-6) TaxID=578456 RepID=UPI0003F4959F|nr:uncharacterized protein TREMEDRAFT_64362 [Tremella mesenterica DSM 1558]EIW67768.1 hypothetical protein TREMEDRAFT_64362 [Tremella mesenterica DSM 1558]